MLVLFSRSRVVLTRFDYLSAAIFTYLTTTLSSSNTDVSATICCFHKLLYFPTDYLTRAFRADAIAKAVQVDMEVCEGGRDVVGNRTRDLTITRVFLGRTFASLGSVDLAVRVVLPV